MLPRRPEPDADSRSDQIAARVGRLLTLNGDEHVLDAGAGAGALAFALAPNVRDVVALDLAPRPREEVPNVAFVEGDITALPFAPGEFDLVGAVMVLHHVAWPETAMAELTRVTRHGGTLLVVDHVAPADPLAALELNRVERARDPSIARILSEADLRGLFEQNGLVMTRDELRSEAEHEGTVGWFVLRKPLPV